MGETFHARIKRAAQITGWMQPRALRWLAEQVKECERVIEVGVYRGRTTRLLLDNSMAHIWCVDSWIVSKKHKQHKRAFMRNIVDDVAKVTVMHMPSIEAAKLLRESHGPVFDMVFIDGSHKYAEVKADILEYKKLVRPGGLLSGHDYSPSAWPGVVRAVEEMVPNRQLAGQIWWVRVV